MPEYAFTPSDFDVFHIPGLEPRMDGIIRQVRPKLERIGDRFASELSLMCGDEMFAHVAKHARRTVHPPIDTWVAWSDSKRGYKSRPHFQTGLFATHLFVQFALIYECPDKTAFARRFLKRVREVKKQIPDHFCWSGDHTKPESKTNGEMSAMELKALAERLITVKKAELLCGVRVERTDPAASDDEKLLQLIKTTFETVMPLYKMAIQA